MAGPGPHQRLEARVRQELALAPRMLQAVEVLQLPAHDLDQYLLAAFEENEALRLEERPPEPPLPGGRPSRAGVEATERHSEWLASQPARDASLPELVLEQLAGVEVGEALLPWVRLVAESLDANGYLSASDESLLALAGERGLEGSEGELGRAIAVVQGLEPRGVGARGAVEAMLLQLDPREPDYALCCRLLEEFLEDVARNRIPAVARALGVEVPRLKALLERLRELDPRPAAALAGEAAPAVRPDVAVERTAEGFAVRVLDSGLPPVALDPEVRRLARDPSTDPEVRRRLGRKVDDARWLLRAVDQRRETLQRVATALLAHQTPFLEHGPGHLRPLRMGDLARWLGLHTSTVSRAVAGKHAETPWGVLPLRRFFQGAAGGGGEVARDDGREAVRALVAGEDPAKPLSDDELAARLRERGLEVARRTVAKYRQELGIPSSYRRRRY